MNKRKLLYRLLFIIFWGLYFLPAFSAEDAVQAVSGIVSGNVQKVGFRALIFKQAIQYNLAGTTQNLADGTVKFLFQGKADWIEKAIEVMDKGTGKSSGVKISTLPTTIDTNLATFAVIGWTSTSRQIAESYDLVYTLRANDKPISEKEAERIYRRILTKTLLPKDLNKEQEQD